MTTPIDDAGAWSQAIVALVEKASAGVVAVRTMPHRVTSGVCLRDDVIAMADHTLKRQERLEFRTADGAEGTGTLLGRDPSVDLAFLKVDGVKLSPLPASDTATFKAGALAAIVGLTLDAGPSASLGIIGAVGPARRTWRGGTLDQFLRLDVNLYPSQSGAAVVDAAGSLIGLASPVLLRHSAVAVPVATLHRVADELIQQGRIRKGYLGVGLQPVALPAAMKEKTGQESALIILNIEPDSPAEHASLQLGDLLLSINGNQLTDVDELQSALRGDAVGKTTNVKLVRGGQIEEAAVTISERPRRES